MHMVQNENQLLEFARKFCKKHVMYKAVQERSDKWQYHTYNY